MKRAVAVLLGVVLLAACSGESDPAPEKSTPDPSATGENSVFTEAGNAQIIDDGEATIDLRGPVETSDLGATSEAAVRDLDVGDEDPVELTLLGEQGELTLAAESIRFRVQPKTKRIRTISVFEDQEDTDALVGRLREVGPQLGTDTDELATFLSLLAGNGTQDAWLKKASALGFSTDLHPVHKQDEGSFVEYRVTPPT